MKLLFVACLIVLTIAVQVVAADHSEAVNPTDVGTVRVVATGQGGLGPPAPVNCLAGDCPDHLYLRFDSGPQALRGSLDVPLEIKPKPDPFTRCNKFKGSGNLGVLTVEVVGDLCARGAVRYSLSASMQVFDGTIGPTCEGTFAAAGHLEMVGAIKTLGPTGLPYTLESVATFIGGAGHPTLACP